MASFQVSKEQLLAAQKTGTVTSSLSLEVSQVNLTGDDTKLAPSFRSSLSSHQKIQELGPSGNPISRFSQVIVAAVTKWGVEMPQSDDELFEVEGKGSSISGARKMLHTNGLKFLDRAAFITRDSNNEEQRDYNQCLALARVILRVLDALVSRIKKGSKGLTETKDSKGLKELQRMEIGLVIAVTAMILPGIVENYQRKYVKVFMSVGEPEFFNDHAPDGLESFGSALHMTSISRRN
ncbi:hypothetical protein ACH5RR_038944 [Cinchona calisaya]|uniref:Uncharacterized protein n=1 Tax=Cinchona calisaya TaxID=153742 RepID=A0ABD2XWS2_9GENT